MKKCRWSCGRTTKNISGICSPWWKAAEPTRTLTDDGYKAWLERRRAKVAKAPNAKRQAASMKAVEARRTKQAEFNAELPVTESTAHPYRYCRRRVKARRIKAYGQARRVVNQYPTSKE